MKNSTYSEEKKKQFYETYGRFCVTFEALLYVAQKAPIVGLKTKGLFDAILALTLLEGPVDTALPRLSKYRAVVNLLLEDHEEVKKSTDKVFSLIIDKLVPIRNEIIHGFWFIEASMPELTEIIKSTKSSVNKDGYYVKDKGKSIEEINNWEIIVNECTDYFSDLWAYFASIMMKPEIQIHWKFKEKQEKIEYLFKIAKSNKK